MEKGNAVALERGTFVRPACPGDVEWLVGQLRAHAAAAGMERHFSEAHAREALPRMIAEHVFFVAERDGVPVGYVAGVLTWHYLYPALRILSAILWWVDPAKRFGRAAWMLLREFVAEGRRVADLVCFALAHFTRVSERHLIRLGFKLHEQSYTLEVARG